jgi:hypothetical protein
MRRFLITPALLTVAAAHAQTWVNPVSGNWNDATKWSGGNVPDNAGETAIIGVAGAYAIDFNFSAGIGGLSVSNPSATVNLVAGQTMGLQGTVTHDGLIVVNSTAANSSTRLRTDNSFTFAGSGELRLNANSANLDTGAIGTDNGAFVVTFGPAVTVTGTGRIRTAAINNGVVTANLPGKVLDLTNFGKTNNGMMQALSGGTLLISSVGVTQGPAGQIVADGAGSVVNIASSGITGGTISNANGGSVIATGSSALSGSTVAGAFDMAPGSTLGIPLAGIVNNGVMTVNSDGTNVTTRIRIDATGTPITGTGDIRLNANAANLDTGAIGTDNGGFSLIVGADQTVRGSGRIRVLTTNDGVIQADETGRTLDLTHFNKTNNNLMQATGGGALTITSIGVSQGAAGLIRADGAGSVVNLSNSSVTGGTISNSNGGSVIATGSSALSGATVQGAFTVNAGQTLGVPAAGFVNNGVLTVNHDGSNAGTRIRIDAPSTPISGTGDIRLNANAANLDTGGIGMDNGGFSLLLGADQTIGGSGRIRVLTTNNGVIQDDEAGRVLDLTNFGKTNNNLMQAANGGTLLISSIGIAQSSAGRIVADGANSVVNLSNSSIAGGALSATDGGAVIVTGSSALDSATVEDALGIVAGATLGIPANGFVNDGVVTINTTGDNITTRTRNDANATISGTGSIRLNANANNLDTGGMGTDNGTFVLTLGAGQTVGGRGRIRINTINDGVIQADQAGDMLDLTNFGKTNNNLMQATGGGNLQISSIGVTQSPTARIHAGGAGSVVSLVNCGITDGRITTSTGGIAAVSGISSLSGVNLQGQLDVNASSILALPAAGFINNGTITVNPTAANAGTRIRSDEVGATISGTGTIRLNANTANPDTGALGTDNGTFTLALGAGQTLEGSGRIRVSTTNGGRMSPGLAASPIGVIDVANFPLTQTAGATLAVDVAGTAIGQYDRVTSNSTVNLDGTLEVDILNGFVPVLGDEFVVISAASRTGTFEQIVTPNPGPNNAWRVRYEPTRAVLTVTCAPDIDGDHTVSLQDLAVLLAHFGMQSGAHGEDGDLDGDGDVELQDLAALLATFGTTCP